MLSNTLYGVCYDTYENAVLFYTEEIILTKVSPYHETGDEISNSGGLMLSFETRTNGQTNI